jgi:hypothetical protein
MEEQFLKMGLLVVYYGVKIGLLFKQDKDKQEDKKKGKSKENKKNKGKSKNQKKKPPRK